MTLESSHFKTGNENKTVFGVGVMFTRRVYQICVQMIVLHIQIVIWKCVGKIGNGLGEHSYSSSTLIK